MNAILAPRRRHPGTLAERFWSLAHSAAPIDDAEPAEIVRHVLSILDALAAGEVGDGVSQCSLSFLALLRQSQQQGDLSYASPEQARGESIDERSLVFSVGVLLFEELTGRHPFGQTTARRFARIKKGELGSGVQYFPQVPTELRSMLVQAMGPFPEERFASLAELRRALEAFLVGPPPIDEEERTRSFQRPVMFAPGISLPPDTFTPPPLPMSRPIAAPQLTPPPARKRRRAMAVVERAGWLALGVAVAWGAMRLPLRSTAAVVVAAPPLAAPVAAPPVAAPPVGASAAAPSVLEPPAPVELAAPVVHFDAALAANAGAEAARKCFDPMDHTVAFGAGLLFAPDDAQVHRAFLSPDEPLAPEARRCVQKALVGASAGAPPEARVIVEARFKLRPNGEVEVKLAH